MSGPVSAAVEGIIDAAVVKQLFAHYGVPLGTIYPASGKENLRKKISGYNQAAAFSPWFVLVDLNHEAPCAPRLRQDWLPQQNPRMYFRVAVRMVEAWLLADRESLAQFLEVPLQRIAPDPDCLENPKKTIIQLAQQSSSVQIQKDMVPRPSSGRLEGPAYASRMIEFVIHHWNIEKAKKHSPSLQRCCRALERLRQTFSERS